MATFIIPVKQGNYYCAPIRTKEKENNISTYYSAIHYFTSDHYWVHFLDSKSGGTIGAYPTSWNVGTTFG